MSTRVSMCPANGWLALWWVDGTILRQHVAVWLLIDGDEVGMEAVEGHRVVGLVSDGQRLEGAEGVCNFIGYCHEDDDETGLVDAWKESEEGKREAARA